MKPIAQLFSHALKKCGAKPTLTEVMTSDIQNDISNAIQSAVKILFLFIPSASAIFVLVADVFNEILVDDLHRTNVSAH